MTKLIVSFHNFANVLEKRLPRATYSSHVFPTVLSTSSGNLSKDC